MILDWQTEQGTGYQYDLVPQFYRDLMAEMDSNRDGEVTAEEIRQALAARDPLVKNMVNRLIVKQQSERYGGRVTRRREGFHKNLDSLEVKYCKKWQADLEFINKARYLARTRLYNQEGKTAWYV